MQDKDTMDFIKTRTMWQKLSSDWETKIKPFAEKHGAKRYGAIGTCWGTYMVLKLCSLEGQGFRAGVSWHPSHTAIVKNLLGEIN